MARVTLTIDDQESSDGDFSFGVLYQSDNEHTPEITPANILGTLLRRHIEHPDTQKMIGFIHSSYLHGVAVGKETPAPTDNTSVDAAPIPPTEG